MNIPQVGALYEHSKIEKQYKIIGIAKHSETMEELVIYEGQYEGKPLWARPLEMFLEEVEINRKKVPRFRLI